MTGWYLPASGRVGAYLTCFTLEASMEAWTWALGAARCGWYLQQVPRRLAVGRYLSPDGWVPCRRTNNPANQSGLVLFGGPAYEWIDGWMHGKGL